MLPQSPPQFQWLDPWQDIDDNNEVFVRELLLELSSQHAFYGLSFAAIAKRVDCDDVLFSTSDHSAPYVVVHMTWRGREESDLRWPHAVGFKSWGDWIERCFLPDHNEYFRDG